MDYTGLAVNTILLLYSIWFSFFWWFRANRYLKMNKKKQKEYRKKFFFTPQVLRFDYYDQNPQFEMWLNRTIGLLFILLSILAIILSLHGRPIIQ